MTLEAIAVEYELKRKNLKQVRLKVRGSEQEVTEILRQFNPGCAGGWPFKRSPRVETKVDSPYVLINIRESHEKNYNIMKALLEGAPMTTDAFDNYIRIGHLSRMLDGKWTILSYAQDLKQGNPPKDSTRQSIMQLMGHTLSDQT